MITTCAICGAGDRDPESGVCPSCETALESGRNVDSPSHSLAGVTLPPPSDVAGLRERYAALPDDRVTHDYRAELAYEPIDPRHLTHYIVAREAAALAGKDVQRITGPELRALILRLSTLSIPDAVRVLKGLSQ